MKSVLDACKPRPELLAGSFNPDVFTASLGPVIDFYRYGRLSIDSIYTDARQFFGKATFPTQGLRTVLSEVFGRLKGDMTFPAIHRLETAFGGGKTHALIACTHLAHHGTELADLVGALVDPELLPNPGEIAVVGIAGDKIPVHERRGSELLPYTLWGEIAYQIGGEDLYREVQTEAESFAAPGKPYFDRVFRGRKVLIMLDELAQYAARLEAARTDGADQLAAFLLSLHDFARNNPGVAIVLTLASAADAFAKQTETLAKLVSDVSGKDTKKEDALAIGEKALLPVASVVARDAVQVIPVQASEISSVLAGRLFESIDRDAAKETVEEYVKLYSRNSSMLPAEAAKSDFARSMIATYPFHPTLLNFLSQKLALAENFQGTRGVLRVLALTVRDLWMRKEQVPMIHACHINLHSEQVTNEILGRTGSSDLLFVRTADVGGVATSSLEGGRSNAQTLDEGNPHPEGYPMFEWTWKTVFLNSLVGRDKGLDSKVMGITEPEAMFAVSFPGLTPSQVKLALEKIEENAYYLKFDKGRYYADTVPTIEQVLAGIRRSLRQEEIQKLVRMAASDLVKPENSFITQIESDVSAPEHIPDKKDRLVLAVISPLAEEIDVFAMFTTKGPNKPREQQNSVLLLVPESVKVRGVPKQDVLVDDRVARETSSRVLDLARQVKAWRKLAEKPQSYGIDPKRLEEEKNKELRANRELDFQVALAGMYSGLYYPSESGATRREIKTGGGESGAPILQQIREVLIRDKKLLTQDDTSREALESLAKLFFQGPDWVSLSEIRSRLFCRRGWPILENPSALAKVIRAGVEKGIWCVYKMGEEHRTAPAEFYSQSQPVPMSVDLDDSYSLVTMQGAKQRGWVTTKPHDAAKVRDAVMDLLRSKGTVTYGDINKAVNERLPEVSPKEIQEAVISWIAGGHLYAGRRDSGSGESYKRAADKRDALLYVPMQDDLIATPAKASELGWIRSTPKELEIKGPDARPRLLPLLKRLGSIYNRGAKTKIDELDLSGLELPNGGTIRIELAKVPPESVKRLGELFEVLTDIVQEGNETEVYLRVLDPDDTCPFIKELKGSDQKPS